MNRCLKFQTLRLICKESLPLFFLREVYRPYFCNLWSEVFTVYTFFHFVSNSNKFLWNKSYLKELASFINHVSNRSFICASAVVKLGIVNRENVIYIETWTIRLLRDFHKFEKNTLFLCPVPFSLRMYLHHAIFYLK